MHEAHTMSTWGAHYVGPVHLEAWGSCGGDGLGRVEQVAASVHTRRHCGTHETHIMSMWVAHYVGPVCLGARGGHGGDGLGGLGRGRQTSTTAMAGAVWWWCVHEAHTTSTLGAHFVGLMQMGGTSVFERSKVGTGVRTYQGASEHMRERQAFTRASAVWH
jgi:hypothetical protein